MSKPKHDLDQPHALPVEDPEAALKAMMAVDPDADPELTDEQVEAVVRAATSDKDANGPPPKR